MDTGRFFPVYIHSRLSEQFSGSEAAYGTTFRDTGGYQEARTSSLKRVTRRISQLVSDFKDEGRNFYFDFLHKKQHKIVKTITAHSKSTASIFLGPSKKYSSRDNIPLISQ
jgi:hypothetical protein